MYISLNTWLVLSQCFSGLVVVGFASQIFIFITTWLCNYISYRNPTVYFHDVCEHVHNNIKLFIFSCRSMDTRRRTGVLVSFILWVNIFIISYNLIELIYIWLRGTINLLVQLAAQINVMAALKLLLWFIFVLFILCNNFQVLNKNIDTVKISVII